MNIPAQWKDARALLDEKTTSHFEWLAMERYLREWQDYDPHPNHLSTDDLYQQSGLTPADLERLRDARLLLPDTQDGRYRPKLVGWGKKLVYLLREGWAVEKIRVWAKGKWKTQNPGE